MDFYQNSPQQAPEQNLSHTDSGNALASASMVLGMVALGSALLMPFFLPPVCGGVAITLALLSKGYRNRLPNRAITGIAMALAGMILHIFTIVVTVYMLLTTPELRQHFQQIYEQVQEYSNTGGLS